MSATKSLEYLNAPEGQTLAHSQHPIHTPSTTGVKALKPAVKGKILMAPEGQTSAHLPHLTQATGKTSSVTAPGGLTKSLLDPLKATVINVEARPAMESFKKSLRLTFNLP